MLLRHRDRPASRRHGHWTRLTRLKTMMPTRNARRQRWCSSRRGGRTGRAGVDAGGGTPRGNRANICGRWCSHLSWARPDCVAGHVRLEFRNVVTKYPFERSHRFPLIQPNSGHRDYSRSSCDGGRRSSALVPASRQNACAGRNCRDFLPANPAIPLLTLRWTFPAKRALCGGHSSPYGRAIFRRINQPYKAARNRISGYRTATIGMSRTSRRPTSDAIQNGRSCRRNGPAEGRKCANFFRSSARARGIEGEGGRAAHPPPGRQGRGDRLAPKASLRCGLRCSCHFSWATGSPSGQCRAELMATQSWLEDEVAELRKELAAARGELHRLRAINCAAKTQRDPDANLN